MFRFVVSFSVVYMLSMINNQKVEYLQFVIILARENLQRIEMLILSFWLILFRESLLFYVVFFNASLPKFMFYDSVCFLWHDIDIFMYTIEYLLYISISFTGSECYWRHLLLISFRFWNTMATNNSFSFYCRFIRMSTDAGPRCSLSLDETHRTKIMQPLGQFDYQNPAKICCQLQFNFRYYIS